MRKTLLVLILISCSSHATPFKNLWQTKDQQAYQYFQNEEHAKAAQKFDRKDWKGVSHYRAGDFEKSVEALSHGDSATSHYNRGNALAHIQQFEDAIAAYDDALQLNPEFSDAKFNQELLEKLLQQQENQQGQSENSQQNVEQEQKDQQQGENDQKDPSEENNEKQSAENNQENDPSRDEEEEKQQQQQAESGDDKQKQQTQKQMAEQNEESEKDQSTDQWLRQIPDDPGGLLKQKFLRDYLRRKNNS